MEGTDSKSLCAIFTIPFHVLTQLEGACISVASAPHYPAEGGNRGQKEGVGEATLRKNEDDNLRGCKGNKDDVPCFENCQARAGL